MLSCVACRQTARGTCSPMWRPPSCRPVREQFAAYSGVEYRVLDIERDPALQGIEPASFDLVIAANVLHATQDLRTSLKHIQSLLAPGGKLVILESTRPVRWLGPDLWTHQRLVAIRRPSAANRLSAALARRLASPAGRCRVLRHSRRAAAAAGPQSGP